MTTSTHDCSRYSDATINNNVVLLIIDLESRHLTRGITTPDQLLFQRVVTTEQLQLIKLFNNTLKPILDLRIPKLAIWICIPKVVGNTKLVR